MSTLFALLPILLVMVTTVGTVVTMIGRADVPARERLPLRRWTVRDVASNASIGWRVVREVMAVAYGARNRSFS